MLDRDAPLRIIGRGQHADPPRPARAPIASPAAVARRFAPTAFASPPAGWPRGAAASLRPGPQSWWLSLPTQRGSDSALDPGGHGAVQMAQQCEQRAHADPRQRVRCIQFRRRDVCQVRRRAQNGTLASVRQPNHHKCPTTPGMQRNNLKTLAREAVPPVRDRDVRYNPVDNRGSVQCLVREKPCSIPRTAGWR